MSGQKFIDNLSEIYRKLMSGVYDGGMENQKLIIYIDESGIHKTTAHSVFVLVYVQIEHDISVNIAIEKIERDLKILYFHWADFGSKAGWEIRKKFILRVSKLPFHFRYIVIKNPINPIKELHSSMVSLLKEKNIEKIFIDGKQPRWYEKQIKRSLRDKGIPVKHLRTVKDQAVPAIRLTDALAALVRLYYDKSEGIPRELYNHIKRNHLP